MERFSPYLALLRPVPIGPSSGSCKEGYRTGGSRLKRLNSDTCITATLAQGPPEEARTSLEGGGPEDHRAPSHISKMVLSTVHDGGPRAFGSKENTVQR